MIRRKLTAFVAIALIAAAAGCSQTEQTSTGSSEPEDTDLSTTAAMPSVVQLDEGYIMGYEDNGMYSYRGVQYGTFERFKYAKPIEKYGTEERPYLALTPGSVSPQSNIRTQYINWAAAAAYMTPSGGDMFSTESQCLNLNIWTSSIEEGKNLPVLVFFHGGGLLNGSATELTTYDGQYFAKSQDCVFVSVNARLNYVGYLDLSSIGGDPNIGVADMVLSLEWVRDHISRFGGNPENITIMGQSGGGTKVTALASCTEAQGLFDKVVYASGGMASGRTQEEADANAAKLTDYIRENNASLSNASDSEIFSYLQNVSYDELCDAAAAAGADYNLTCGAPYFAANFIDEEGNLNETASQYTYMNGSVWAEMGAQNSADAILGDDWGASGGYPAGAKGNISEEKRTQIMKDLLKDSYDEALAEFTAAYPDHDFYDYRSLVSYAGSRFTDSCVRSGAKVYEYLVQYEMPYFGGMTMGHTSDLGFWFHSIDTIPYQIHGDEDTAHKVEAEMSAALAAFCRNGDPSTDDLKWDESTNDAPRVMVFDINSECKDSTFDDRLAEIKAGLN